MCNNLIILMVNKHQSIIQKQLLIAYIYLYIYICKNYTHIDNVSSLLGVYSSIYILHSEHNITQ